MPEPAVAAAVARLDELTRRLRRECPWDREQDERSIVPHTVEEAYELADAANAGDDAKLLDELGDVLFQVHFLSLLLEERGAGRPGAGGRARAARSSSAATRTSSARSRPRRAGEVLRNWDEIKRAEPGREAGIFGEVPENLPALLHARKVQRRAASSRLRLRPASPYDAVSRASSRSSRPPATDARRASSTRSATCSSPPSTSRASCGRPRARAARGQRALPRPRRGRRGARRAPPAPTGTALTPDDKLDLLRPSEVERP